MNPHPMPGLFITGTDTGVGKTFIAAAIAAALARKGRKIGVLKPVATGGEPIEDAEALLSAIGGGVPIGRITPLHYPDPLAPCIAARLAGRPLRQADLMETVRRAIAWWAERSSMMVVEGVGGLLCPLADDSTVADLAIALDYPMILVARRALGTLNHTLLTVEAARDRGLRIAGIVLNGSTPTADPLAESTAPEELIRRLDGIPILAEIPHGDDPAAIIDPIDWIGLSQPPRARSV
ncbi:MAG: dethiobiotin synthase [Isosphaeraceae bacterium]